MRTTLTLMLAATLIAGCSGSEEEASAPEAIDTSVAVQTDDRADDPAPSADVDTGDFEPSGTIPARYRGVWDYAQGTCASNSDLRMEISAREILFYESVGQVTGVTAEGDDVIVALAMEGEGDTWDQRIRLSLTGSGAGEQLETSDGDAPPIVDDYPSKRCI